jgi:hypothetical protein
MTAMSKKPTETYKKYKQKTISSSSTKTLPLWKDKANVSFVLLA